METLAAWATRVDPTTQSCYFKFRIGASDDLFETTEGTVEIKAIPDQAVQWLVKSFPKMFVEPDVMRRTGAVFKWLPRGTVPREPAMIDLPSFAAEVTAWFDDYVTDLEGRADEKNADLEGADGLLEKMGFYQSMADIIGAYFEATAGGYDPALFPAETAAVALTPEEIATLVALFHDDDDAFRKNALTRFGADDDTRAEASTDLADLSDGLSDLRDGLSAFGAPTLDSFKEFWAEEQYKAADHFKDLMKNRANRHELPDGWMKGRCDHKTYYMNGGVDGSMTVQYHAPNTKPTKAQAELTAADPTGATVIAAILASMSKLYTVISGLQLVTDGKPVPHLFKQIDEVLVAAATGSGDNTTAEEAARARYDAALAAKVAKEAEHAAKVSERHAARLADITEATRIMAAVDLIKAVNATCGEIATEADVTEAARVARIEAIKTIYEIYAAAGLTEEYMKTRGDTVGTRTANALHEAYMLHIPIRGELRRLEHAARQAARAVEKAEKAKAKAAAAGKISDA